MFRPVWYRYNFSNLWLTPCLLSLHRTIVFVPSKSYSDGTVQSSYRCIRLKSCLYQVSTNKHSELRALRINTHIPSISTSTGELASTATALYPVLQYWSTSYQYASSLRSTTSTGSSTPSIQYCQSDLVPGTRVVQYEYKLYYSSSFFLPHQASLFSCKSENNENSLIREFWKLIFGLNSGTP